jgi:hypothetical protein
MLAARVQRRQSVPWQRKTRSEMLALIAKIRCDIREAPIADLHDEVSVWIKSHPPQAVERRSPDECSMPGRYADAEPLYSDRW